MARRHPYARHDTPAVTRFALSRFGYEPGEPRPQRTYRGARRNWYFGRPNRSGQAVMLHSPARGGVGR